MYIASSGTEPQFLDIVVIDVLVVVGEDDVAADVAQNGSGIGPYESGPPKNSRSDSRHTVSRLGFVYVQRF
jgi:hypothetical protein